MPVVFRADGRYYYMSPTVIKAFRESYRDRGNAWKSVVGCDACAVVCFHGTECGCPGHAPGRHAHNVGNHRTVASVQDVLKAIRKAAEA